MERALAGAVLQDAAITLRETVPLPPANAFTDPAARAVWAWATERAAAGLPVDLLLAAAALRDRVPVAMLESFVDACPTVAHAGSYAAEVRNAARRRRLADWHRKAGEVIAKGDTAPEMLVDELRQGLGTLIENIGCTTATECSDDAATVLRSEPPEPSATLVDVVGPGDILQLNGSPKTRKSFALLQLGFCIAIGLSFLGIVCTPGPVVYLNLEIRRAHFLRRLWRMAQALGFKPDSMPHALTILHARGRSPEAVLVDVLTTCRRTKATVVILDPIYKLAPTGDENASQDAKAIVSMLDRLAEDTGAAIVYCHHAAKGSPGDKIATDRGAGSGILSRAFDASLSIMPHAREPDAVVCEWTLRNYAPRAPYAARWQNDQFTLAPDLSADPETGRTRQAKALRTRTDDTETLVNRALALLADGPMPFAHFKQKLLSKLNLSEHRARTIQGLVEATSGISKRRSGGFGGPYYIGPADKMEGLVKP